MAAKASAGRSRRQSPAGGPALPVTRISPSPAEGGTLSAAAPAGRAETAAACATARFSRNLRLRPSTIAAEASIAPRSRGSGGRGRLSRISGERQARFEIPNTLGFIVPVNVENPRGPEQDTAAPQPEVGTC